MDKRSRKNRCVIAWVVGSALVFGLVGLANAQSGATRTVFTNEDLQQLQAPQELPEVEGPLPGTVLITPEPAAGQPAGEATPAADAAAAAALQWLNTLRSEVDLQAAIADAERRVRDSRDKLQLIESPRPRGSAFATTPGTGEMYMRDVVDSGSRETIALNRARSELAQARAELDLLLARQASQTARTR